MTKIDKSILIKEELQSRMEQFKEALNDEEKKLELENSILGSEVLIRFEIFFPKQKSVKYSDGLFLYMKEMQEVQGGNLSYSFEMVDAEYYIRDADNVTVVDLETDDFNVVKELFKDSFSLEIE